MEFTKGPLHLEPVLESNPLKDLRNKLKSPHLPIAGLRNLYAIALVAIAVLVLRNFEPNSIENVFVHEIVNDQICILTNQLLKSWRISEGKV
jgi:hypothetical protein